MRLASTSTELFCHDWSSGEVICTYNPQNKSTPIKTISWSRHMGWLMVVPNTGTAQIISIAKTPKLMLNVEQIQHPTCAAFQHSTKRNVAIGTDTGAILIYDIKTRSTKRTFQQASSALFKVNYNCDDSYLVACCQNGEIQCFNNKTLIRSNIYKVPNSKTLSNLKCHPSKRNIIAGCSEEGVVAIWDIYKSHPKSSLNTHNVPVTDLVFSTSQPNILLCIGMDYRLCILDVISNKISLDVALGNNPTAIDFSPDGIGIAIGFIDGKVARYDIRDLNKSVHEFTGHTKQIQQILFEKDYSENSAEYTFPEENAGFNIETEVKQQSSKKADSFLFCGDVVLDSQEENGNCAKRESFLDMCEMHSDSESHLSQSRPQCITEETSGIEVAPVVLSRISLLDEKSLINKMKFHRQVSTPLTGVPSPIFFSPDQVFHEKLSREILQGFKEIKDELKDIKKQINELKDIKEQINEIKEELKDSKLECKLDKYDVISSINKSYYSIVMLLTKESLKNEDKFNEIADYMNRNNNL